jgi:tripartite-type tricarboxylate transporter receptor subunit TctC
MVAERLTGAPRVGGVAMGHAVPVRTDYSASDCGRARRASREELIGALKDPDLVKRFREISTEPMPADKATPEAAQRTLTNEIDRWAPIIKAAGEYAD